MIAGVLIEKKDEEKLKEIKVKDSKMLTPKRREELAIEIRKIAKAIKVIKIPPLEIDGHNNTGYTLNEVEAMKCGEIIINLDPEEAYIDSPTSPDAKTFGRMIQNFAKDCKAELICSHRADQKFLVVSAASIIAKTERDAEIEKIKKLLGKDFGSGYPADEITKQFLETNFLDASLHDHLRKSWATYKELVKRKDQKSLLDF